MIKQFRDLYGKPDWPVTHIDAIVDDKGNSLRKILQDFVTSHLELAVIETIDRLLEDAPEQFNTLKEIADYIALNGYGSIAEALAEKANANSIPTKMSNLDNDANYQTESLVELKIQEIIGTAPQTLDTLGEIAAQLQLDGNAVAAITEVVAEKADKSDIPTKISDLNNDAGYLTLHQDISGKANVGDSYTKNESDLRYLMSGDLDEVNSFLTWS